MKNLKNLGKVLSSKEQKNVTGGWLYEKDHCLTHGSTPECTCLDGGGRWNSECERCEFGLYLAGPDCSIMAGNWE